MVNDLLSDPCAYGQRKKVLMLAYSPPNESPILRILGMNNRNKITFKMLHLTVDAWRLRRLRSFPTAPISHLQQARWFHTGGPRRVHGKRRDSPHEWALDFYSCDWTYPCVRTGCPEAGVALPGPLGSVRAPTPSVGCTGCKEYFFSSFRVRGFVSLWGETMWFYFVVFWRA